MHGAVDGFSRTIVFVKCSNNNRAGTVLELFREGVSRYGLPDHIRSDHGGENVDVWRAMIANHHGDYSCVLTGSSVHNERIERLWRDIHQSVCSTFAETFRSLETEGVLDPLNEVDLFCLHYIYLPKINKSLNEFEECWNCHALSTEGNMSPYQLLFEGLNHVVGNHDYVVRTLDGEANIDVTELTQERVHVPRLPFTPCNTLAQGLHAACCVSSNGNLKELFITAVQTTGEHLLSGCSECVS